MVRIHLSEPSVIIVITSSTIDRYLYAFVDANGKGFKMTNFYQYAVSLINNRTVLTLCDEKTGILIEIVECDETERFAWTEHAFPYTHQYTIRLRGVYISSGRTISQDAAQRIVQNILEENHIVFKYPRIRNLPVAEKELFRKYLNGQTCPIVEGIPMNEQDFYYPWDYDRFSRNLQVID